VSGIGLLPLYRYNILAVGPTLLSATNYIDYHISTYLHNTHMYITSLILLNCKFKLFYEA
jgi:hypothetical protein